MRVGRARTMILLPFLFPSSSHLSGTVVLGSPHSPGPTLTSVPDSDRLPSGTLTLPTERALSSMAATDWGERTPLSRKRITRSGRPYICLRCPLRRRYLSTALSYAPLKSGLTSSKVSWVGFRIAIQHIHP